MNRWNGTRRPINMPLRLAIALAVILALLAVLSGRIHAASSFGVSPTSQDLTLRPGESYSGSYTVANYSDAAITLRTSVSDYSVNNDNYADPNFTALNKPATVSPVTWFKLPSAPVTVPAQGQAQVPYTVTVPRDATVGGHYAAAFSETTPVALNGSTGIARVDRVGNLFFLTVGGTATRLGSFAEPVIDWLQTSNPLKGSFSVTNTGTTHFLVDGQVRAHNLLGGKDSVVALGGQVLPSTTRRFDITVPTAKTIGLYQVTSTAKYGDGKTFDDKRLVVQAPLMTLIVAGGTVVVLLFVALFIGARRLRRRR